MSDQPGSESIYRAPSSDTTFNPQGDLLSSYVGPKNADYYERKFEHIKSGGGSISWNWPAFFITSIWLLYRKMWLNAFLYWIVLPVALMILAVVATLVISPNAGGIVYYGLYFLIAFVLVPMLANRLYYRHAQAKANKVASITSSAEQQAAELSRIGGTSNVVLVVVPFILIAGIGILAAIAIPAYQDYTIRAQISEGLNLSGAAKAAVAEYYYDNSALPADNAMAGLSPAENISGRYTSSVSVQQGVIVVTYGNEAHMVIKNNELLLEPDFSDGDYLQWQCRSEMILSKHLPAACR
ncbi:MAG: pilin [Gammaproteobacteria bacterium]|nr:pilin [Gammaproteobacteria bacterium]